MHSSDVKKLVQVVHNEYRKCGFKLSHKYQFTVLAAFILTDGASSSVERSKVISMATGCKCLPDEKRSRIGCLVHDSHAEVLAHRGAIRWLYQEIQQRAMDPTNAAAWLDKNARGRWKLKEGVRLHLYVSTVPCESPSRQWLLNVQIPSIC